MNIEPILERMAAELSAALPQGNPWRGRIYATVAEPKDGLATWGVVYCTGEPREIVAGNATMQAECKLYAQLLPAEGPWSAVQVRRYAVQLCEVAHAYLRSVQGMRGEVAYLVLGAHPSPGAMQAEAAVGYTVELPFTLTVQF